MSLNDPQRGGGRQGPPDLDDIFRNLLQKAGLGGGARNGAPSSGGGSGASRGVAIALGVMLSLWAASGFYIVNEQQDAVVLRFGRYVETVDTPGLHWHFPWPIEKRIAVNMTEIRSLEVGGTAEVSEGTMMLTADQNVIVVQLEVQYTLKSAYDFVFNNRIVGADGRADPEARAIVQQAAESAIREVVGRNNVNYVLNEGRSKIGEDTRELMQGLLDRYNAGVSIARVNIAEVQAPKEVQEAFVDAVKARQDRDRLINEGTAYANNVVPLASGTAQRLLKEAEGYRSKVVARAEGDAARFAQVSAEYAKAPQVTRDRIYFDTMQQIMQRTSKVVVDQKGSGNLLYLPLDKLMQVTSGAGTPANEAAKPAQPAVAAPVAVPAADVAPRTEVRNGR